jgi:hypothetical protein
VPAAVHPVGAKLAAQSWIGIRDRSGAPDVRCDARGIPGDALGAGCEVRGATPLLRNVAVDDALLRGRLIPRIGGSREDRCGGTTRQDGRSDKTREGGATEPRGSSARAFADVSSRASALSPGPRPTGSKDEYWSP